MSAAAGGGTGGGVEAGLLSGQNRIISFVIVGRSLLSEAASASLLLHSAAGFIQVKSDMKYSVSTTQNILCSKL